MFRLIILILVLSKCRVSRTMSQFQVTGLQPSSRNNVNGIPFVRPNIMPQVNIGHVTWPLSLIPVVKIANFNSNIQLGPLHFPAFNNQKNTFHNHGRPQNSFSNVETLQGNFEDFIQPASVFQSPKHPNPIRNQVLFQGGFRPSFPTSNSKPNHFYPNQLNPPRPHINFQGGIQSLLPGYTDNIHHDNPINSHRPHINFQGGIQSLFPGYTNNPIIQHVNPINVNPNQHYQGIIASQPLKPSRPNVSEVNATQRPNPSPRSTTHRVPSTSKVPVHGSEENGPDDAEYDIDIRQDVAN